MINDNNDKSSKVGQIDSKKRNLVILGKKFGKVKQGPFSCRGPAITSFSNALKIIKVIFFQSRKG